MPAVSLVIPVYNSEEFLPGCLESVVSQTMRDMEIICVDDGSTDSSPSILADFASRDPRMRIVRQENAGQGAAREHGLGLATGTYVMFLDNDDDFEPTMVEEAYERCVADGADITVFKIRYVDATTKDSFVPEWALRMDLLPAKRPFNRRDMPSTFFIAFTPALWNKMFRRSFLVDADVHFRPDLRLSDDLAFTYAALALADKISVIDKALVNYRTKREGSLWTKLSEHPMDIVFALREAKHRIVQGGVYADVQPAFENAALSQCLYNLSTIRTHDAFRQLYDALKTESFEEFGLLGHDEGHWVRPEEYRKLVRIMDSTPEQYLMDEVRTGTQTVIRQRERIKKLTARLAKSEDRRRAIEQSASYRLARGIAAIPRSMGRALRATNGGKKR